MSIEKTEESNQYKEALRLATKAYYEEADLEEMPSEEAIRNTASLKEFEDLIRRYFEEGLDDKDYYGEFLKLIKNVKEKDELIEKENHEKEIIERIKAKFREYITIEDRIINQENIKPEKEKNEKRMSAAETRKKVYEFILNRANWNLETYKKAIESNHDKTKGFIAISDKRYEELMKIILGKEAPPAKEFEIKKEEKELAPEEKAKKETLEFFGVEIGDRVIVDIGGTKHRGVVLNIIILPSLGDELLEHSLEVDVEGVGKIVVLRRNKNKITKEKILSPEMAERIKKIEETAEMLQKEYNEKIKDSEFLTDKEKSGFLAALKEDKKLLEELKVGK